MNPQTKLDEDSTIVDKTHIPDYINSSTNKTNILAYFNSSDNKEADKRVSKAITNRIHNEFNDLISAIGHFEGMFFSGKRGQLPISCTTKKSSVCATKKTLKEELGQLQKQQIIVPSGIDETSEYNSFILVAKHAAGQIRGK